MDHNPNDGAHISKRIFASPVTLVLPYSLLKQLPPDAAADAASALIWPYIRAGVEADETVILKVVFPGYEEDIGWRPSRPSLTPSESSALP